MLKMILTKSKASTYFGCSSTSKITSFPLTFNVYGTISFLKIPSSWARDINYILKKKNNKTNERFSVTSFPVLLRAQSKLIYFIARNVIFDSQILGSQSHWQLAIGVG